MKNIKKVIMLLCIICPLVSNCGKKKPVQPKIDKTAILYEQTLSEITDSLCYSLVAKTINREIKQKIDFSECIIRLKKYTDVVYTNSSTFSGEGFFEGKVKGKKGAWFYEITLKNSNNRRIKDESAWELRKLIIKEAGKSEVYFSSGKEVKK